MHFVFWMIIRDRSYIEWCILVQTQNPGTAYSPKPTYWPLVHCAVSNNRFLVVWFGLVRFYQLFGLGVFCFVLFIRIIMRIWEKKSLGFAKQIIRDLVPSCTVTHIDNLLDEIWKFSSEFSFLGKSTKRKSLVIRICEFTLQLLFIRTWGVWYLDTHGLSLGPLPGSSQVVILIAVTLVSHYYSNPSRFSVLSDENYVRYWN